MAVVTDLRRLLNFKKLIILFLINLCVDIISISNVYSLKPSGIDIKNAGDEVIFFAFDRYFCVDISIISFAMYICLFAFIAFCVINRISEDNQKFGIFYLTRYSRKSYISGKLKSTVIFAFFVCEFSVFQSFLSHRIMKITVLPEQYITVMLLSFILAISVSLIGMSIYSVIKNNNIAFLITVCLFTAQSSILTQNQVKIPTAQNISDYYIYPLILLAAGIILFVIVTYKNDFITTKIKE